VILAPNATCILGLVLIAQAAPLSVRAGDRGRHQAGGFEVMVADERLDTVERAIRDAARNGRKGDGKI